MNDTVKLLRECNSGIKMGKSAIEMTMPKARSSELRHLLNTCKDEHSVLGDRTHTMLLRQGAETKEPHLIAKAMSDAKIYATMAISGSDKKIASLMTDGCNMGVKSISTSLNKYKKASPEAKDIARKLIDSESALEQQLRSFL